MLKLSDILGTRGLEAKIFDFGCCIDVVNLKTSTKSIAAIIAELQGKRPVACITHYCECSYCTITFESDSEW